MSDTPLSTAKPKRSRLLPAERREIILDAAISLFSRKGFTGTPREIAKNIGISPALIYRYFETKENLVRNAYEKVFLSIFKDEWLADLNDDTKPLRQRLINFYLNYGAAIDDPHWVRFAMYSALDGFDLMQDYLRTHVDKFIELIAVQMRKMQGADPSIPPTDREKEQVWIMHSSLIYFMIRKYIHNSVYIEVEELAGMIVDTFLNGISQRRPEAGGQL